ncbi:MAG: WG repeat-containing protein [Prevotella sp.]|nr:WG repeat-containing protein [Prevotella sp.]
MAIVKFVSDKTCQIFIDKEFAGKVNKDSILKLTLEPGGYLIEIKDKDEHIHKKYNLEIKTTDNQVLQDVSYGELSLDDAINQLKNDPSLEFHCNRASFCYNGLYGYVNKRFEVVIPAIYTVANKFKDDKAFVVREFPEGKKTTLIDEDGNMFFNKWFDYIGESDDTILLGIEDRIIVYSKKEFLKKAEFFNAGYNYKDTLIPVYKNNHSVNLYGYINFDGNEVIPLVFNNAGNFNEQGLSEVIFLGKQITIDKRGFIYGTDKKGNYLFTGWDKSPESIRDLFYEYENTNWDWFGDYEPFGPIRWEFTPIWDGNKWNLKISKALRGLRGTVDNKEKSFIIECDYVLEIGIGYCVFKVGRIVKVIIADIINEGFFEFSFEADSVKPILRINKSVNGDDDIYPESFRVFRDDNMQVIDMDTILSNIKQYGYNRFS